MFARLGRRLPAWISYVGPDLLFLGIFLSILLVICAVYHAPLRAIHGSTFMPIGIMLLLIAVAFGARIRGILRGDRGQLAEFVGLAAALLRDWSPLVAMIVVYDNFHDLTHVVRPDVVDGALRRLDETLLGVEPTLWCQKITRPWLTEYMTFSYALFFVFPTLILTTLYARKQFIEFREFGLALSIGYYLGLLGYMTVPAIGPRYAMAAEFTVPLTGYWLTEPARVAWNSLESVDRDCFPSLHTAMSTISLVYLWRLRGQWRWGRPLLAVSAVLIVSLWASTIYLRYHYAVDVLAGWALAALCVHAAPAIVRWYYGGKTPAASLVPVSIGLAREGSS
jgi:membrane-associated phospholipid phosphatase